MHTLHYSVLRLLAFVKVGMSFSCSSMDWTESLDGDDPRIKGRFHSMINSSRVSRILYSLTSGKTW